MFINKIVKNDAVPRDILSAEPAPEGGLDERLLVQVLDLGEDVDMLMIAPTNKGIFVQI